MSDLKLSAAALNRTPTSLGMLSRSPLPTLLVNLAKRTLTGTLLLKPSAGGEHGLVFRNGTPVKLSTHKLPGRLGEILVKQGKAAIPPLQQVLERALREGHVLGELLVAEGVIDRPTLEAALRTQIALRLGYLGALPGDTLFEFYTDLDLVEGRGLSDETPIDFLMATTSTVRGWNDTAVIDETLQRIAAVPLVLHPYATPDRFGFTPPERGLLKTIQAGRPQLTTLLGSGVDPQAARVVIYTLAITRHLDLGVADSWPMGVRPPSSPGVGAPRAPFSSDPLRSRTAATPGGRSMTTDPLRSRTANPFLPPAARNVTAQPTSQRNVTAQPGQAAPARSTTGNAAPTPNALPNGIEAHAREIRHREQLLNGDYYKLLGLTNRASVGDVQAAYFHAAKILHPDRIPPELDSLRQLASKIFSEVSRAHRTLSDPKKRAEYDASLAKPAAGANEVERVMLALQAFQRAEALMRKGDFAHAEPLAKQAVEGDPNQGQYLALLGWIRASKGIEELPAALKMLDQAVQLSPAYDQGHFFRAVTLKRAGREDDAFRSFRRVVELNPHHVDAAREVHLYGKKREERNRTDTGGTLGKLFRK
jgi:tetratricopeptide (TPR) repeat protein